MREKSKKLEIILLALLFLSTTLVSGQGFEEWSNDIGGDDTEHFKAIAETADGGYIITGYVEDWNTDDQQFYLVKTDSSGQVEWSQLYGGEANDDAYSGAQTSEGGYLIGGRTKSVSAGIYDAWLILTNQSGEVIWEKKFGGAKDDAIYSLILTENDDCIAVGGTSTYGAGSSDIWVLKTSSQGDVLWNNTFGGSMYELGNQVISTSDGGYLVVGETSSYGYGWSDIWLVKLDQDRGARTSH